MYEVYMDIEINKNPIGRIVFQLFKDDAIKASKNFYNLCIGDMNIGDKELSLVNNQFHRVIKNFMIQAGDLIYGSDKFEKTDEIGKGGCSIYAEASELEKPNEDGLACYGYFEDENKGEFSESFLLAMANTGVKNTNSSQFFITTNPCPHLNGKHTIFGKVIEGKSVVRTIEYTPVDEDGFPTVPIVIADCGIWSEEMGVPLFNACNNKIGGDVYEEYPEDDQHFEGEDFAKAYEAANIIKESGSLLFKRKDYQNALFKYQKALKYVNEYIPEADVDRDHNLKFNSLKSKLYLNICLMLYYLKNYDEAIKYSSYLLEMDSVPEADRAKAHFRKGNCYFMNNRLELALEEYKSSKMLNPDIEMVDRKIEITQEKLHTRLEKTKKNISKFFQ